MVDLEGPSQPLDKDGNRYGFTYICCLCHAILLDRSPVANARECRRMFASCVLRSGRFPNLLRSDRGPELKNILMQEYCALVGVGRRFGTPWRPVEQGLVEGLHKETQKIYGMLVFDVFKCMPSGVYRLQHTRCSWLHSSRHRSSLESLVSLGARDATVSNSGVRARF